jgi:hypothetical protein
MESEYHYTVASESELDGLLAGHETGLAVSWTHWSREPYFGGASTGVVWTRGTQPGDPVRPLVVISKGEALRHLYGRYAQLRSDLSPLTAWCHIVSPDFLESQEVMTRRPDLRGLEAAWTGLAIAEAALLAERPVSSVRMPACLATHTFAVARTKALWSQISTDQVIKSFDSANRICRSEGALHRSEQRTGKLRTALRYIWDCLVEVSFDDRSGSRGDLGPVVESLWALRKARLIGDNQEARRMAIPLYGIVREAEAFNELSDLTPEMRLRLFDRLVDGLSSSNDAMRRNVLAFLAGYLATVAAGGAPSLSLAESTAQRWPEITAWAYLVGGVGERVIWTSGFDGLGRLVARELIRPLRFDEPPTCDFALDEAAVLADSKLADPLVHLRVKQSRVVTVALFPGVNVSIPIGESSAQDSARSESARSTRPTEISVASNPNPNFLAAFADALWPFLKARLADQARYGQEAENAFKSTEDLQGTRSKRRHGSTSQLPLNSSKK